jgi:hypothetical protein
MTTEPIEEPVDLDDPELFGSLDGEDVPATVKEAFEGRRGVFVLVDELGPVRAEAREHEWHTVTLDTSEVDDRRGFVALLADAFDLTDLDAGSWDDLDQHLRALDLDEPNGLLICWEGWGRLADDDPDTFEMAVEVFQDACIAWQADNFQAAVLLVGDASETDLPTW